MFTVLVKLLEGISALFLTISSLFKLCADDEAYTLGTLFPVASSGHVNDSSYAQWSFPELVIPVKVFTAFPTFSFVFCT